MEKTNYKQRPHIKMGKAEDKEEEEEEDCDSLSFINPESPCDSIRLLIDHITMEYLGVSSGIILKSLVFQSWHGLFEEGMSSSQ